MQSINYQLTVASNFPNENYTFDLKVEAEEVVGTVTIHSFTLEGVNGVPLTIPTVVKWMTLHYCNAIREEMERDVHLNVIYSLLVKAEADKRRIG